MVASDLGRRTCPRSRCAAHPPRAPAASRLRARQVRPRQGLGGVGAPLPSTPQWSAPAPPSSTSAGGGGPEPESERGRGSGGGQSRAPPTAPRPSPARPPAAQSGAAWGCGEGSPRETSGGFPPAAPRLPRLRGRRRRDAPRLPSVFSFPLFPGEPRSPSLSEFPFPFLDPQKDFTDLHPMPFCFQAFPSHHKPLPWPSCDSLNPRPLGKNIVVVRPRVYRCFPCMGRSWFHPQNPLGPLSS